MHVLLVRVVPFCVTFAHPSQKSDAARERMEMVSLVTSVGPSSLNYLGLNEARSFVLAFAIFACVCVSRQMLERSIRESLTNIDNYLASKPLTDVHPTSGCCCRAPSRALSLSPHHFLMFVIPSLS